MVIPVFPQGEYDHSHAWQNASDRESWMRTFSVGTDAQRRMAQAMITANPVTPNDEIRLKMATYPDLGPPVQAVPQPTIDDVLGTGPGVNSAHLYDRSPTDFSGTPAGTQSSSTPSISAL